MDLIGRCSEITRELKLDVYERENAGSLGHFLSPENPGL